MAKALPNAATKVRPKHRKRPDEPITYDIQIDEWDWSYSFGVTHKRRQGEGPYDDFRHLHLKGTLLRPPHIKSKNVAVIIIPDPALDPAQRSRNPRTAIGTMSAGRGELGALLSMPADGLTNLLVMLTASKFRFLSLEGTKLHYGQGTVTYLRFDMTDPDPD